MLDGCLLPFDEFDAQLAYGIGQVKTEQDPLGMIDRDIGLAFFVRSRVGCGERIVPRVTVHCASSALGLGRLI